MFQSSAAKTASRPSSLIATITALTLCLIGVLPAFAQDDEKTLGWSDTAELSIVAVSGNSEAETLGFNNTLKQTWEDATFTLVASALRAEQTTTSRSAVGSLASFDVVERSTTELSAENYLLRGRYDRDITEQLFWFAGASWDRNEFAGIQDRYQAIGGIGRTWFDNDTSRFSTDIGLTYTEQDDVVPVAGTSDGFLGARLGYDYWRQLTDTTEYTSTLGVDLNADETSDYRADFFNSLAVSMSDRLALKLSLRLLYDNEPSFAPAPLFALDGSPTGLTVPARADDLDSIFSAALVIDF